MRTDSRADIQRWIKSGPPGQQAAPGYDEWLKAEIAAGIAELDAGKFMTLEDMKREFGQE
ncbi:hypothetical protein [Paracoccus lichenicola]|uniref:hypothetical protein n=1 Tax=Paracoccus lichenicola TaxID=2665644 RepID=UPI0018A9A7BC|nr:hypothetical protein [Paracoccus lichenicola]